MNKKKTNRSTPQNDPDWYEGKPGPAPTGLKRDLQIPFMVNAEEKEFTYRLANSASETVNQMLRSLVFKKGWRSHLAHLRKIQGSNVEVRFRSNGGSA